MSLTVAGDEGGVWTKVRAGADSQPTAWGPAPFGVGVRSRAGQLTFQPLLTGSQCRVCWKV